MEVVDPGAPEAWPRDIYASVELLVRRCRADPSNADETPSYELRIGSFEAADEAEREFRDLFGERCVALYHATRLLPHEQESVRDDGLVVLSIDHRSSRLDSVIQEYGEELGVERLELLRDAGPLRDSVQRRGRLGIWHGVTPLEVAFDEAGYGMSIFLENWGGETFYWAASENERLRGVLRSLTAMSTPVIVEAAVPPMSLCSYRSLWRIFVAQLDGRESPWHEFSVNESVSPDRVLRLIRQGDDAWPASVGTMHTD
jgi:hypothetical protein